MKDEDVVSSSVMLISSVSFMLQADNLPSNAALRRRGAASAGLGRCSGAIAEQTMAGVKALCHRLRCLPWQPWEQTLISGGDGTRRHRRAADKRLRPD